MVGGRRLTHTALPEHHFDRRRGPDPARPVICGARLPQTSCSRPRAGSGKTGTLTVWACAQTAHPLAACLTSGRYTSFILPGPFSAPRSCTSSPEEGRFDEQEATAGPGRRVLHGPPV